MCNQLDLIYGANHSFYKYCDISNLDSVFLESEFSFLANILCDLDKFNRLKPQMKKEKEK